MVDDFFVRYGAILRSTLLMLSVHVFSGCTLFSGNTSRTVEQVVYYVTTRAVAQSTPDENDHEYFSSLRGKLQLGVAKVKLPPDDNPNSLAKTFDYLWANSSIAENTIPSKILLPRSDKLDWVAPLNQELFFAKIAESLTDKSEKRLLFYIHGFKRDFGKNLESGARLAYETAYPGPTVVFSWPSTNSLAGYTADRGNADWSTPYLTRVFSALNKQFPDYKIDVVAHSMGNRVLINALLAFNKTQSLTSVWPFSKIVLLAPDVDRAMFIENYAAELAALPSHFTIYVSEEDFPLMASGTFNAYPRLGDARAGAPVVPGMETVDVSNAITMAAGHAYYRKSHAVAHDLYLLLNKNLPANQRQTLKPAKNEVGLFWQLIPEPEVKLN